MVQLMGSSHSHKVDDFTEEEYGPLSKRPRFDPIPHNQNNEFPSRPAQCNPLEEPSPLGLRLKKSPSLLDLIQMRLSKSCSASSSTPTREFVSSENKKDMKSIANDKLKASNFPASLLKIGSWEYVSRYEGDLVAKCYFAKHKLVWEVLEAGLKSKIEIQWSDIMALKADCPDDAPGSLTIMLARQPVFFQETNPQPRKHTLWQSTSDFTDGQASINRQHYIQCPPGVLNKHYEKLIQCDMRLGILSQHPEKVTGSPFFELSAAAKGSLSPAFEDATSTVSREMPSPSSVMDTHGTEGNKILDERNSIVGNARGNLEVPGFRPSMSLNDFMNLFGECISEQMNSGSLPSDKASECRDMLENISQVLLSDNQLATGLDEKSLMKKVNSLCCLLQDPIVGSSSLQDEVNRYEGVDHGKSVRFEVTNDEKTDEWNFKDREGSKKVSSMQRIDSLGDFLLHLPRIASLPKFLYGIAEDDDERSGFIGFC